jgi:signal transduction histidine kinase
MVSDSLAPTKSLLLFEQDATLAGGGEMGARMREIDWASTPLGPVQEWPRALKTATRIMLTSRQPMFIWWGEQFLNLYNDAYAAIVGDKHPWALAQPAETVWAEIWDQVGPRAQSTMLNDEGTYDEALLLVMNRHGYEEETYFTFSYSPVPNDAGGAGGILGVCTEETRRIVGERQLALLRELAAVTAEARTIQDACTLSSRALQTSLRDLPFALIYLYDVERQCATLAGTSNIAPGHPAVPGEIALDDASIWPLAETILTNSACLVSNLDDSYGSLPHGDWTCPPRRVAVLPIMPSGQGGQAGILVAGLNPFCLYDDAYQRFLVLVASQISAAVANAQAYEVERERAEALAELDRAKTTFFSNVSHELRTPLTLLLGPIEDALADTADPLTPAHRERQEVAQRNAMRLLRLVNTLLDFSRIEAGRIQASYELTDLPAYTADLAASFRSAIERAGLALEVECPPLPVGVSAYVDREMWEKVVLNLLSNAFKFTFEGSIGVSLRAEGDRIVLRVRDTGTGIASEELPRLFDRFHRAQNAPARTHEGTGIGLALVKELVGLHGGEIAVESTVGQGTMLTVSLPAGAAHLPGDRISTGRPDRSPTLGSLPYLDEALSWLPDIVPPRPDQPSVLLDGSGTGLNGILSTGDGADHDRDTRRPRVLVVDDNRDMREYVARLLGERFEVETVGDGEAALAVVRDHPPDLVLSDVMMPRLDGFGLVRALRDDPSSREIPIILLSARAGEEASVEGLQGGADDYLIKPFSARELVARVETHIALSRMRAEATSREHLARHEAEQAVSVRDEFLSIAAHELRTPIASLSGQAQLLERRLRRDGVLNLDRAGPPIQAIVRQSRRLSQLITQLLELARLDAGKLAIQTELVELEPLIEAAVVDARGRSEQHIITIEGPVPGQVVVDPIRLEQVLGNLLDNAIKYSPEGGPIEVGVAQSRADRVEISVRDYGLGIPPDRRDRLFERYYQAHGEGFASGMGLGLYVSRQIVSLHDGDLRAEFPEDGGTRFVVGLPAPPPPS